VLTPQEVERLFATLRGMVADGLSVVFISHKLDEVLAISHRIAVLRAGRLVADLPAHGVDKAMLAEAMVGRRVAPAARRMPDLGDDDARTGRIVLGTPVLELDEPPLQLCAGEVLAIAGVAGNGQQALAARLCGEGGRGIRLLGRELPAQPRAFVEADVARIPEDRHAVGVVGDLSLAENAVLERYRSPAFSRSGFMRWSSVRHFAASVIDAFDVRGGGPGAVARSLSGGNMQKLILGRALLGPSTGRGEGVPRLIVADQPTWGLDVGAVAYVHQQLLDAAASGSAVLLISEDLDEIFALADRIAVMHAGQLSPARPREDWTLAQIGLAMAGAHGSRGTRGTHDAA
jgi:simple sugar transport system ATP-binding protein